MGTGRVLSLPSRGAQRGVPDGWGLRAGCGVGFRVSAAAVGLRSLLGKKVGRWRGLRPAGPRVKRVGVGAERRLPCSLRRAPRHRTGRE